MSKIEIIEDRVADDIDDLACVLEHWVRNRDRGRTPSALRAAIVQIAREIVQQVELEQEMARAQVRAAQMSAEAARHGAMVARGGGASA